MNNVPQADLAIAVQQLGFSYPGSGKPALSGISMTVRRGSCLGLLGPNGAGKSTLLSLLTGILPRQSGEIHLFGKPLTGDRALRRDFALVPQDYAFYPTLRVRQNLECFAGLYGLRGAHKRERIDEVVAMCRLESVFNQCAAACSGGVRRRLNLAIGLLNQPRLLYLDEPTVGIDAQSRHFILASIKRLREAGMTVVYTSHYMDEVQALCDELVIVDEGRILLQDTLANVMSLAEEMPPAAQQSARRLEDFYLSLTQHALRE